MDVLNFRLQALAGTVKRKDDELSARISALESGNSGGPSSVTWGAIGGSLTAQTDLSGALAAKADASTVTASLAGKEPTITGGTTGQYWRGDKSWQTLDKSAVGLGNVDNTSDANKPVSTAQQAAMNLLQPLDADLTAIAALSGTAGLLKKTAANTWALDTSTYLTGNQTITLSGDVSGSGTTAITVTIGANKVTRGMLAATAGATILGATAAGTVTDLTAAQAKTFLAITASDVSGLGVFATGTNAANLTGTVAAAQMPALTGDVTSSAGSVATTIAAGAVSLAKMANVAAGTVFYRKTAGSGAPEVQTLATLKTDLGLTGTNSGDQTSVSGSAGFVANAVTFNISGGAAAGASFDGSAAKTIDYSTVGALPDAPRVQTVTSSAMVTPTFSNDMVKITAQAVGLTLANPTGIAIPSRRLIIRIKDNGTAQTIAYGTQYRALGNTLPTTTVVSKTLYLGLIHNSDDTKWDVVAVAQEA